LSKVSLELYSCTKTLISLLIKRHKIHEQSTVAASTAAIDPCAAQSIIYYRSYDWAYTQEWDNY